MLIVRQDSVKERFIIFFYIQWEEDIFALVLTNIIVGFSVSFVVIN